MAPAAATREGRAWTRIAGSDRRAGRRRRRRLPGRPPVASRLPRRPPRRPRPCRRAGARSPGRRPVPRAGSRRARSRPPGARRHPARRSAGIARRRATTAACEACLIVGGILVVLLIVGGIAASVFIGQLVEQVQENPDAVFGGECQLVSSVEVGDALGEDVEVLALEGFADGTMGAILDKRAAAGRDRLLDPGRRHDGPDRGGRHGRRDGVPQQPRRGRGELPRAATSRDRRRGVLHDHRPAGLGRRARPVRPARRLREHGRPVASTTRRVCETAQVIARTLEP